MERALFALAYALVDFLLVGNDLHANLPRLLLGVLHLLLQLAFLCLQGGGGQEGAGRETEKGEGGRRKKRPENLL